MSQLSNNPAAAIPQSKRRKSDRLRTLVEMGVSLVVLVTLFRGFLAGGYVIETGSMAPCLVGYHRRATCPSCRYAFAVEGSNTPVKAICPNCGLTGIAVEALPRNDGDHLLVHRALFEFRQPRRWEVIVFRNPNKPTQAYVKRLIGLPGESVQIESGDVYIGGEIQKKSYATQRGIRIPVYDHDFRPAEDDPTWQPRWVIDSAGRGWKEIGGAFHFAPGRERDDEAVAWVNYRNWVRYGGGHATSVSLARWPAVIESPKTGFGSLSYEEDEQRLGCTGALSADVRDQLLEGCADPDFQSAVEQLYEASHVAPITDGYGYNRGREGMGRHAVRDLMLSAEVLLHEGSGEFVLAISDGTEEFECVFDLAQKKLRLIDMRTGRAMRTVPLGEKILSERVSVEFSLMDRQVLLAVDGKLAFKPWNYQAPAERGPPPSRPVRFGAKGVAVEISSLKLFRDVYYTDAAGRRAIAGPLKLKSNEYYVLGDNSPVSKDSRSWSEHTVLTSDMFLGKPLVVHLPSRKQTLRLGGWQTEIRIPEFSRIRYIH